MSQRHDYEARARIVLELLTGTASAAELAARHGLDEAELQQWKASFLSAMKPKRSAARMFAATVFVACLGAGAALSQAIPFPITLTAFQANTPAVASQVNANFNALKNAVDYLKNNLEAKVGAVSNTGSTLKATTIHGDVTINGNLTHNGEQLAKRWVIEAAWNPNAAAANVASSSTPIDLDRLSVMCGDRDGCTLRMVNKDWGNGSQDISMPPVHFEYQRPLFLSSYTNLGGVFQSHGPNTVADGNGVVEHALRAWNCYLTDGQYSVNSGTGTDGPNSMYLLNYNADPNLKPTCMLIIDD